MTSSLRQADYQTLAAFRYELRRFLHFSEEAARTVGIEPQQHQALLAIKGFPRPDQMLIGELAERLQIRHHSAVGLVSRLVAQGLLERVPSATDRRQVVVRLTAEGEVILETLSVAHRAELQRLGPQLVTLLQELIGAASGGST